MAKDFLCVYELYGHTEKQDLQLFGVGSSNWDYYSNKNGALYSIVKPEKKKDGCQGSIFGDCNHVKHLLKQGHFEIILTAFGRGLMVKNAGFAGN